MWVLSAGLLHRLLRSFPSKKIQECVTTGPAACCDRTPLLGVVASPADVQSPLSLLLLPPPVLACDRGLPLRVCVLALPLQSLQRRLRLLLLLLL